jgi:hypothetical protein
LEGGYLVAYIGNSPANVGNYQKIDALTGFNGVLVTFNLLVASAAVSPAKSGLLLVSINGVMQEPDDAGTNGFKVVGSTIVFSTAPATGSPSWIMYQGQNVDIGTPSNDTVGVTQLSATGTASSTTYLRGDNTWATVAATTFPFYKADGTSDTIAITSGTFPFYKADGTADNIGVS